jgi:dihydrodipicolinate synthase/N-acetylneuraminate lyase
MSQRYPPCILATVCVPWNEDGSLAEEIFRRQIRIQRDHLTPHLYIFGTAGEGYAVDDRQFDEVCRVFREETDRPGVHGMVGVISLSLATIIDRIGRARDLGFRAFQISLPCWGAMSDEELRTFFREVCGRFPDCSFLHYNLMRTKRLLTPEEYATLARAHPNLVATKNGTDAFGTVWGLITRAPELRHFLTENGYACGCQVGSCGLLISIASTNHAAGRAFFAAGQQRDFPKLWEMQGELLRMLGDLLVIGAPEAHMDGAYDKVFCKLHDPAFPLRLLPPYRGFSDEAFGKFAAALRTKYPRWAPGA